MKKQLLLAEDDPMLASLLSYRFSQSGYEVIINKDGKAVKDYITEQLPDAIICDIMMPYYSGMELLDYVRNELKSNVPFILISSASNDENLLRAFEMGVNDFVSKPLSIDALLARVSKEIMREAI